MDHAKIACLCYAHKVKATDGLFKLLVTITCSQNLPHIGSLHDLRCALRVYEHQDVQVERDCLGKIGEFSKI